jgi:hypothetical protein
MDVIDSKSNQDLLQSLIAESAKATAEIRDAKKDLDKAANRIKFVLMLANKMIERQKD